MARIPEGYIQQRRPEQRHVRQVATTRGVEPILRGGQQIANALGEIGDEFQQKKDIADAMDADSWLRGQLRELQDAPEGGYLTAKGQAAVDAFDAHNTRVEELYEEALNRLSPSARARAQAQLDGRRQRALDVGYDHSRRESDAMYTRKLEAGVDLAAQDAIGARDDMEFQSELDNVAEAARVAGQHAGYSGITLDNHVRAQTSAVVVGRVATLATDNPYEALEYARANAHRLQPTDLAKIEADLGPRASQWEGREKMRGMVAPTPQNTYKVNVDYERAVGDKDWAGAAHAIAHHVAFVESGNNPDAVSPADAVGLYQFLPSTARPYVEKALGRKATEEEVIAYMKNPDLAKGVYVQEMGRLLQKYDGNLILALSAYNAGDGALEGGWRTYKEGPKKGQRYWYKGFFKVLGDPRKGEISWEEFAAKIPFEETRGYVAKYAKRMNVFPGGPPPTRADQAQAEGEMDILQMTEAEAMEMAGVDIGNPHEFDEARREFALLQRSEQQRRDQATQAAKDELWAGLGEDGTSMEDFEHLREAVGLDYWERAKRATATKVEDDIATLAAVERQIIEDPNTFLERDFVGDIDLIERLSPATRKRFAVQQGQMAGVSGTQRATGRSLQPGTDVFDTHDFLQPAGQGDPATLDRQRLEIELAQQIGYWASQTKEPITDEVVRQLAEDLVKNSKTAQEMNRNDYRRVAPQLTSAGREAASDAGDVVNEWLKVRFDDDPDKRNALFGPANRAAEAALEAYYEGSGGGTMKRSHRSSLGSAAVTEVVITEPDSGFFYDTKLAEGDTPADIGIDQWQAAERGDVSVTITIPGRKAVEVPAHEIQNAARAAMTYYGTPRVTGVMIVHMLTIPKADWPQLAK